MKRLRRAYYDRFSRFYDRFVALHSGDKQGLARLFLADRLPVKNGASILDVCTGTGSLLSYLQMKVGARGRVVGLDFSRGMLKVANEKIGRAHNVQLVEADAAHLPFASGTFDALTCSHAFYELKGAIQDLALQEIIRVLRPQGVFLMMEHDVPRNPLVRALFYLRLIFVGTGQAISVLRHEQEDVERRFRSVEKVVCTGGQSKIMICMK